MTTKDTPQTALTKTPQLSVEEYSQEKLELIKRTVAVGATNDELMLFIYQARKTGLDPLARQIYFIKDPKRAYGKVMIQTSIDGFRVVAQRSGQYAGQDEPSFEERNGKLHSCKVAVYKWHGDTRYQAGVGVALLREYASNSPTWTKMPYAMLAKVAEALALRKAFPQDLSGIYSPEEMDQADVSLPKQEPEPPAARPPAPPVAKPPAAPPAPAAQTPLATINPMSPRQAAMIDQLSKQKQVPRVETKGWNTRQASAEIDRLLAI